MTELIQSIECDFNGKILQSGNERDNESKEIIKNVLYIIQDIAAIKSKVQGTGNFVKLILKNSKSHFEVAVGNTSIKINQYKA